MSLEAMQSELTLQMDELTDIARRYGFDAVPTVVMRHKDGANKSVLMTNDAPEDVIGCIAELAQIGVESSQTGYEAALKLISETTSATA